MLYQLTECISNSLTYVFEPAIGQRVQYTANTGIASISTANSNRDGTGSITNVITGSGNGTLVETVTIKASGNTTRGMVRLFLTDGSTFTNLITEVNIPERTVSSIDNAFAVVLQVDFMLKSGYSIAASTQNAEAFNIIAEGLNTAFP